MQEEIWKDIPGYEGLYKVSSLGRVMSCKKGNWIILSKHKYKGYHTIILIKSKERKSFRLHRLVANAFIINKENKPQVNHINGIKSDNSVDNLEWCNQLENNRHRNDVLNYSHSEKTRNKISLNSKRKIKVKCTETLKEWDSITQCSNEIGVKRDVLNRMLRGTSINKTSIILKQNQ